MTEEVERLLRAGRPTQLDLDAPIAAIEGRLFGKASVRDSTRIGRYHVVRRCGGGTQASVYAVFDPDLQREVALKLLHQPLSPLARRRLAFEARALAHVRHPNVLEVYDTGTYNLTDRRLGRFIVTELVDGANLAQWLRTPRTRTSVMGVLRGMGEGLAALHRAGLVHRDFKPTNVLLSLEDVPRVADLGLALDDSQPPLAHARPTEWCRPAVGTPLYMAPEQHANARVGPAADQYAYCVCAVESLTGAPPFSAGTAEELAASKLRGPDRRALEALPRTLAQVLARGMHPDPARRWPSMDVLLEKMGNAQDRRALYGGIIAAAAIVCVISGVVAGEGAEPCKGAQAQLAEVWGESQREAANTSAESRQTAFAEGALRRATERLDLYAQQWISVHTEACEATMIHGVSPGLMDLRMRCLHTAKIELGAVASSLATATPDGLANVHEVVDSLPSLSRCANVKALSAKVDPPRPADAAPVAEVRRLLARARASSRTGQYATAREEVAAAREAMSRVDYGPLHAELRLVEGDVLQRLGSYAQAEEALTDALRASLSWRQRPETQRAATALMYVLGVGQMQPARALTYRALALGDDPNPQALQTLATVLHAAGDYAASQAEYERAIALHSAASNGESTAAAKVRSNMAGLLLAQGNIEEAEAEYRRALAVFEVALGSKHPVTVAALGNVANVLHRKGAHEETERAQRRVLQALTAALGGGHPRVAAAQNNLGLTLHAQGRYEEAQAQFEQSYATRSRVLRESHPRTAKTLANAARTLSARGLNDEAETKQRTAVTLLEGALGPTHPDVATAYSDWGAILVEQGRLREAAEAYRHALRLRERALPPAHPSVATSQSGLAGVLLELREPEEALELAERAWRRRREPDIAPERQASTAFVVARALWGSRSDRSSRRRAAHLASGALTRYEDAGRPTNAAVVDRWLRSKVP